jgi:hypothetical protein
MIRRGVASLLFLGSLLAAPSFAYGPKGHGLVGAIADQRLAGKPIASKIADLLDGLTLAEAALLPDKIKDWDKYKDPQNIPDTFHLPDHSALEAELLAFWQANPVKSPDPKNPPPSHHRFHFTDVPVAPNMTYAKGKTGRSPWDVVHMIPFCADVLQGKVSEDNPRKITKRIAVILLAHFVGDIHQPLHVGAQYFNAAGQPVNADENGTAFADEGGNSLLLVLEQPSDHGHAHATYKLHGYWDDQSVETALALLRQEMRRERVPTAGAINQTDIARRLAVQEPAQWNLPADSVANLAVAWADEILPVAQQAHERLNFSHIKILHGKTASGQAIEQPQPDRLSYQDFAGRIVRVEIHKAGWRLASLLERVVP